MSNDCQTRSDRCITNDIRAESHGFTDMYETVENDMVMYGSEM
jgi:hypothetical protein